MSRRDGRHGWEQGRRSEGLGSTPCRFGTTGASARRNLSNTGGGTASRVRGALRGRFGAASAAAAARARVARLTTTRNSLALRATRVRSPRALPQTSGCWSHARPRARGARAAPGAFERQARPLSCRRANNQGRRRRGRRAAHTAGRRAALQPRAPTPCGGRTRGEGRNFVVLATSPPRRRPGGARAADG